MAIGSAIFLAALVFALLYLYKITWDRWNWQRMVRWSLMTAGTIVILFALGLAGVLCHGPAPQAFVVVPIVGAFFIDLMNLAVLTFFLFPGLVVGGD